MSNCKSSSVRKSQLFEQLGSYLLLDFICGFNPATTHFFDLAVVPKGQEILLDNDAPF